MGMIQAQPRIDFNKDAYLENVAESSKSLALLGWYLNYWMQPEFLFKMNEYIKNNKVDQADKYMCQFIQQCVPIYKRAVLKNLPERKKPFTQAFFAHENRKYYLSIPVLYSQIEGAVNSKTGIRLFSSKNKHPKIIQLINNMESPFKKAYLSSWQIMNEQIRIQDPLNISGANRHDVLHGISNDYGTFKNSCKAFSLLFFTLDIIIKENHQK